MILSLQIHFGLLFNLLFDLSVNGSRGVGMQIKKYPILLYKNHHEKEKSLIILLVLAAVLRAVFVSSAAYFEWEHLKGKKTRVVLFEFSLVKPNQMIRNPPQFFPHLVLFQIFYLVLLHNLYSLYLIPYYLYLVRHLNPYYLLIHHLMEV